MENIKKGSPNAGDELNKEVLRRHRDEDIRDDDAITSDRVADSKLPATDTAPDEIPEEHETGNTEVTPPNEGGVEHGEDNEADYRHEKEVTPPNPEHEPHKRDATLTDLDPTFIGIDHGRTTGRMIDHEPGTPNNV